MFGSTRIRIRIRIRIRRGEDRLARLGRDHGCPEKAQSAKRASDSAFMLAAHVPLQSARFCLDRVRG
jgi:hypothetical protein